MIHKAIQKYGVDNFSIEIVEDGIPSEFINEKEKYWIMFYDSNRTGYNQTPGGDGRSLSDKTIELINKSYFEDGLNCNEIVELYKISHSAVYHRIAANDNYDKIDNQKRSKKHQYREVSMYDSNGNYVKDFDSLASAAKAINT